MIRETRYKGNLVVENSSGVLYSFKKCLSFIGSVLIALLRLLVLEAMLFVSGINQIVFGRRELCNVEMRLLPLRCDKEDTFDKLSYIDKLCTENPELLNIEEPSDEDLDKLDGLDFPDDDDLDGHGDSL